LGKVLLAEGILAGTFEKIEHDIPTISPSSKWMAPRMPDPGGQMKDKNGQSRLAEFLQGAIRLDSLSGGVLI
jgi:hypothetical protein